MFGSVAQDWLGEKRDRGAADVCGSGGVACVLGRRWQCHPAHQAQHKIAPTLFPLSSLTSTSNSATFCTPVPCSVRSTSAGCSRRSWATVGPACAGGAAIGGVGTWRQGQLASCSEKQPSAGAAGVSAPARGGGGRRTLTGGAASTLSHRASSRSCASRGVPLSPIVVAQRGSEGAGSGDGWSGAAARGSRALDCCTALSCGESRRGQDSTASPRDERHRCAAKPLLLAPAGLAER